MSEVEGNVEVIAILRLIRSELQGNAEDSVICQLDTAIQKLELMEPNQLEKMSFQDWLVVLGHALDKVPAILALYELLRQMGE